MPNAVGTLFKQIHDIWLHFGVNQKVSVTLALLVVLGAMGGVLYWSSRPNFALLYAGMSMEDAAAAREKLSDEKIVVELRDSGRAIYVPAGDVYRGRLVLASAGLPKNNTTGFELFEQPKFGLTDFAQKVNYQRALQGELERTIASMDGIQSARVMLVLPSDRLFASESEKKASASVMLGLASGSPLAPAQVRSIRQLVGSAVPGLSASAITVSDQQGRMLSQRAETDENQMGSVSDQIEVQERLESMLTRKAQSMLDSALGEGRSIVRVSAQLDFSRVEKRSEKFEAEGRVVAKEKISSETSSAATGTPGGPVGVMANVAVNDPSRISVDQSQNKSKKEDISTEYKIPSDVEHVIQNGVKVKGLSVSVCVAKGKDARTDEQKQGIEKLVGTAVGLVDAADRKDSIKVVELDFPAAPELAQPGWVQSLPLPLSSLINGATAVVILLIIFLASRKVMSRLSVERQEAGVPVGSLTGAGMGGFGSPAGAGGMGMGMGALPGGEAGEMALDQVARLAEQNPKAIASWITTVSRRNT